MHDKTALIPEGSQARGNTSQRRWKATALASAAALVLLGASLDAQAVALGAVTVRSALGEPLRAEIEVPQISSEEAASFKAALGSRDAFQKAGVEYSQALVGTRVSLQRRANGQAYLRVEGSTPINEPFLSLVIEADWGKGGHIVRDYAVLIDPPARAKPPQQQAQVQPTLPQATQIPPRPTARPVASRPQPPKPPVAQPSGGAGGDQVTVKGGDTASSILKAHPVAGVSLDQMLIALLRANPHAFINNNVNLVRTGAVLTLPTAEQASALSPQAARRNFVAQVHEFNEYRNKTAANTPKVAAGSGQSTKGGTAKPAVPAPPKSPDQVIVGHAGAPDNTATTIADNRQIEDQKARQAELDRTRQELEKLAKAAGKASQPKPSTGSTGATTTTPLPPVIPPIPVNPPPVSPVTPQASAPQPQPPVAESPKAEVPPPVEAAPPPLAPPSVASQADSAPVAPVVTKEPPPQPKPPVRPQPPKVAPKPAPAPEPGIMDTLGDNLLAIVGGVVVVILVIGGLLYSRGRKKKAAASLDSSFIESRLQPDSFFGASGGQHVNTRDAGDAGDAAAAGNSSSLAYSPSQLDAAGDVDPVAEADVYLAYGRDQQAEEILREAMRTHQGRVSIHRKLAEIYAKRRDARALQGVATEARNITHGSGPDWQAIAALGAELDPANPLYTPGGMPPAPAARAAAPAAPAPAAKPQLSEPGPRASFSPTPDTIMMPQPAGNSGAVDLDLGLDQAPAAPVSRAAALAATEPVDLDLGGLNFTPPPAEPATRPVPMPAASPATDSRSGMVEFDMGSLSAPDSRAIEADPMQTKQPAMDEDPIGTKLALAQEFHAIGDDDGARSLIKEVIAEAKGSMKARAERFLAELS